MRNKKLGILTLVLLLSLLVMHIISMKGYWYIKYPCIDLPMHFLGGLGLALSVLYIFRKKNYILPLTFILGIFWELFELYYHLTGWPFGTKPYFVDTGVDLVMDMLGALVVWVIYKYIKSKNEHISNIS